MQAGSTRRGAGGPLGVLLGAAGDEEEGAHAPLVLGHSARSVVGSGGSTRGLVPHPRIVVSLSVLLLVALLLTLANPPSTPQASTPAGGGAAGGLDSQAKAGGGAGYRAGGTGGAGVGGSKVVEEAKADGAAEEARSSGVEGTAEAAGTGPDPSRPSRCTAGCEHGTCNEELGECFCHVSFAGANCSAPAFPACHLAPGYWTPCWMFTTCECMQQCQALRLAGEGICFRGRDADGRLITNLTEIFSGPRYLVPWNTEHTEVLDATYDEPPFDNSSSPLSSPEECPNMCSGHGVCRNHACQCSWGSGGNACQSNVGITGGLDQRGCLSGCSGRGSCHFGECHCEKGFFGIDCSLFLDASGRTRILPRHPYNWTQAVPPQQSVGGPRPRVYVYDLPAYFNTWQSLHSPGMDWPESVRFLERLLGSAHRTADPEEADFFYLPLLIRNRRFEKENVAQLAVDYVRAKYPFYARSNGTDHIILTNEDWGSCQLDGPSGRGFLPPFLEPLIVLTVWAHSLNMAMGTERPCFRPGRDIAIPPLMVPNVYRHAPNFPLPERGGDQEEQDVLLYFRGSSYVEDSCEAGKFCRSLGARQALFQHYEGRLNETGVLLETSGVLNAEEFLSRFRRSRFCYAPAGFGWAMRTTQAAIMGCIPVVIQPNVVQPFQGDGLNWDDFAVILTLEDVPRLHHILRDMPEAEVRRKQDGCFRVRSRFVWSSYSANPLDFLPQEKQDKYAPDLLTGDAFAGIMEALRLRLNT